MKITDTHVYFWEGPFSNWTTALFDDQNGAWHNTEQAFMFYKALFFGDGLTATSIKYEPDPQKCKRMGRAIKYYHNASWEVVRESFMIYVNYLKYSQNEEFKAELLNTGNKILVEASPLDRVWGVGLGEDDPLILDESKWDGLNLLGKSLMTVRKMLKK
jgi:ribA/ribD-fused uncharacterized protein